MPRFRCDDDEDPDYDEYDMDSDEGFNRWFEDQKVERTCQACKNKFMGMPDHGFCDPCADKREQGWDLEY